MEISGQQACAQTASAVYGLVAEAMTDPVLTRVGQDHGYDGLLDLYVAGRCGVLGDVDADVVVAAFGFFQPDRLRVVWERVLQVAPARDASRLYGPALAARGAAVLDGFDRGARLAELIERVVDAAPVCGLPLFAGWRAEPRPEDPRERACHAMHLLREWRGGAHVAALTALGIPPFDAVVTNGGPAYTEFYEWPSSCEGTSRPRDLRAAEELTDGQCAPVFASALTAGERGELVSALAEAVAVASAARERAQG